MEPLPKRRCTIIDTSAEKMYDWLFENDVNSIMVSELLGQHVSVKKLHTNPNIYIIDNFLNETELLKLNKLINTLEFEPSMVYTYDGKEEVSEYKTSSSAAIPKDSKFAYHIYAKINRLMPNVAYETPLQVIEYKKDERCEMHHDGATLEYDYDNEGNLNIIETDEKYKRIMTGFLYLTSNKTGSTYFPLLNLNVKPVAGRLLLFPNILDTQSLKMDIKTIHEAKPVKNNIKRGINIWFLNKHLY